MREYKLYNRRGRLQLLLDIKYTKENSRQNSLQDKKDEEKEKKEENIEN